MLNDFGCKMAGIGAMNWGWKWMFENIVMEKLTTYNSFLLQTNLGIAAWMQPVSGKDPFLDFSVLVLGPAEKTLKSKSIMLSLWSQIFSAHTLRPELAPISASSRDFFF